MRRKLLRKSVAAIMPCTSAIRTILIDQIHLHPLRIAGRYSYLVCRELFAPHISRLHSYRELRLLHMNRVAFAFVAAPTIVGFHTHFHRIYHLCPIIRQQISCKSIQVERAGSGNSVERGQ